MDTAPPDPVAPAPIAPAPVIRARGLSKSYLMYADPADRLRQAVVPRARRLLGLPERRYFTEHWALRPLSFEVPRGRTLAVIGRNGSGKSTLLQLVCGTLTPTTGEVAVTGRVAALLELGSGFNPEFTGRENVLLNASVLGLPREAILERLEAILDFAGIGDFVDHPVKTYSSGMTMRLAFAVIAHVDADVLVVDEALAVGDAFFQQKCLRWLRAFQERGTVLFCGHDAAAVAALCEEAIWLDRGEARMQGPAKEVAEAYAHVVNAEAMGLPPEAVRAPRAGADPAPAAERETERGATPDMAPMEGKSGYGSGAATITHAGIGRADGAPAPWFVGGEEAEVRLRVVARDAVEAVLTGFVVHDRLGQAIASDNDVEATRGAPSRLIAGEVRVARYRFVMPDLAPGEYTVSVSVAAGTQENHVQHHWVQDALRFVVNPRRPVGTMMAINSLERRFDPE